MIITQDHIDELISYCREQSKTKGTQYTTLYKVLECINIKRAGRWTNTSFILDTDKQQLVVEEES